MQKENTKTNMHNIVIKIIKMCVCVCVEHKRGEIERDRGRGEVRRKTKSYARNLSIM